VAIVLGPCQAADPEGAERQYRMARRLAAEGSPEAGPALMKVLELDPEGSRADDALVDRALLAGIARWPEALGRVHPRAAAEARAFLDRTLNDHADSDRAPEARYYRALLFLEPIPGHDSAVARQQLILSTTRRDASDRADAARYAVAWLDEQLGSDDRAMAGYQRLLVDAPSGPAGLRARVGLARMLLRRGEFGAAARWVQEALDGEVGSETDAAALRELAVRLLTGRTAPTTAEVVLPTTGVRQPGSICATRDGGLLLVDRKLGTVKLLGPTGKTLSTWTLQKLVDAALGPRGSVFAATEDEAFQLRADGTQRRTAALGEFDEPQALALDGIGGLWLLDRKGERLGRIAPGAGAPTTVWENKGARVTSMAWDGRRMLMVGNRDKTLYAVASDGIATPLFGPTWQKPILLAADHTGRVAVLDEKSGTVTTLGADGSSLGTFNWRGAGLKAPAGMAFGADGVLHLLDQQGGKWMRVR